MSLIDELVEPDFLLAIFVALCVGATLMTLASLLSPSDTLAKRMKSIASERERLRQRQRTAQSAGSKPLRHQQRGYIKDIVEKLALSRLIEDTDRLDDLASELLRPMLQQWLDDNLPVIVERLVRAEIERVARGGRA